MSNRFKKGDLVKHSCAGKSDHMNAIFMGYIKYISPRKVIVKYTEGDRKGRKGEWLEEYVIAQDVTNKKPEIKVARLLPNYYLNKGKSAKKKLDFIHKSFGGCGREFKNRRCMVMYSCTLSELEERKHKYYVTEDDESTDEEWDYHCESSAAKENGHALDALRYMDVDMAAPGEDYSVMMDLRTILQRQLTDNAVMASHKHKGKENIMKAIITETYTDGVLTETLINDRNVEDLGSGELLGYATSAQQAIEKLAKHDGSKCKFLAKEHKRLQNFIDSVYVLVDQKNGLPPA